MYRIDNATAVPNGSGVPTPAAVGPNPNGYFTNSGVGQTIVDGDWMNAVQEEIAGVIEASGATLSKTNRAQLLAAVKAQASFQPIGTFTAAAVASINIPLSTAYRRFRLTIQNAAVSAAGALIGRFSSNGGSSFLATANYTTMGNITDSSATNTPFGGSAQTGIFMTPLLLATLPANPADGTYNIWPGTASAGARTYGTFVGVNSSASQITGYGCGVWAGTAALMNYFQVTVASGTLTGTFILEGML